MEFREFFRIVEDEGADWSYFGELHSYIGNNKSETLNYGSGTGFQGKPFLYVPVTRESSIGKILSSARRRISQQGIECKADSSAFNGWKCQPATVAHNADMMHTGESHVTVASGEELNAILKDKQSTEEETEFLKQVKTGNGTPLFDAYGNGITMPVTPSGQIVYGVAKYFRGTPMVALMAVECPMVSKVREALSLPPRAPSYKTHITIGYAFGVTLGDVMTTDTRKGTTYGSASQIHNVGYKKSKGIDESILRLFGIEEYIVENLKVDSILC
jgi:hypothetical protein